MLFLYNSLSLLPKSGNPSCMSLQLRNIEPSEGIMYLSCSLAWIGRGCLSPQDGAQSPSFSCADNTFFLLQIPSSALPCTLIQVHLPFLWIVLTLWLIPDFSMSCGQAEGFCCSLLLLFTQMNFSWFPTRACEWVAWASFLFFFKLVSLDSNGCGCLVKLEKCGGSSAVPAGLEARPPFPYLFIFFYPSAWDMMQLLSRNSSI